MSHEPRSDQQPAARPARPSGSPASDELSPEQAALIQRRLDERFYDGPQVVDTIAMAVKEELRRSC